MIGGVAGLGLLGPLDARLVLDAPLLEQDRAEGLGAVDLEPRFSCQATYVVLGGLEVPGKLLTEALHRRHVEADPAALHSREDADERHL